MRGVIPFVTILVERLLILVGSCQLPLYHLVWLIIEEVFLCNSTQYISECGIDYVQTHHSNTNYTAQHKNNKVKEEIKKLIIKKWLELTITDYRLSFIAICHKFCRIALSNSASTAANSWSIDLVLRTRSDLIIVSLYCELFTTKTQEFVEIT